MSLPKPGAGAAHLGRTRAPSTPAATAVVLLALLLAATTAYAQQRRRHRFDLFAEGGGSFFTPKSASQQIGYTAPGFGNIVARETTTLQDSGRVFVGGDYWFTQGDAIQVSYSYSLAGLTETTQPLNPPIHGGYVPFAPRASTVSFDYMRSFRVTPRWQLLVLAGVGRIWRTRLAPGSFVVNLGVGAEFAITCDWGVRMEYRDFIMPYPTAGFVGGWVHNHAPTIGIVYHF